MRGGPIEQGHISKEEMPGHQEQTRTSLPLDPSSTRIELEPSLEARGKGQYTCPYGLDCDKGVLNQMDPSKSLNGILRSGELAQLLQRDGKCAAASGY